MHVSVIVTTFNQPAQLEKVIWGYAAQRSAEFELVIADDGSAAATAETIDRAAAQAGLEILHVWHEDRGFRKTEILNRAVLAAHGDYLIFSDGDCIPRDDFVESHVRLARPNCFLSGGYIKLSEEVSAKITVEDIKSGRALDAATLRSFGWHPGKRGLRLLRSNALPLLLDVVTPTRRTWNGHNSSTWREAILAANGFDMDMGYGGEDRALGERLVNAGMHGKQVRHRAPCLHLFHNRPYVDKARLVLNREIRRRIQKNGETRARTGIDELSDGYAKIVKRPEKVVHLPEKRIVMAR